MNAPRNVVLPAYRLADDVTSVEYVRGWNACRAECARLNQAAAAALLQREQRRADSPANEEKR